MSEWNEKPVRYSVVESDRFSDDRDRLWLGVNRTFGHEYAERWIKHLTLTISEMTGFPGPLSHARDEEASVFYGREVRRLLYYGPTRRRTGTPARLLFTLLRPAEDDPNGETVIFLLRLLHGPQALTEPEDAS